MNSIFTTPTFNWLTATSGTFAVACSIMAWRRNVNNEKNVLNAIFRAGAAGAAIPNALAMLGGFLYPQIYTIFPSTAIFGAVCGVAGCVIAINTLKPFFCKKNELIEPSSNQQG